MITHTINAPDMRTAQAEVDRICATMPPGRRVSRMVSRQERGRRVIELWLEDDEEE